MNFLQLITGEGGTSEDFYKKNKISIDEDSIDGDDIDEVRTYNVIN